MRRIRRTRRAPKCAETVHLPPGVAYFDVTAHTVCEKPAIVVGPAGLELREVVKLPCPMPGVTHVGRTVDGKWAAFAPP